MIYILIIKNGGGIIRILLLSHGYLAKELYETAKLIIGDVSDISYLEYPAGQDLVLYKKAIAEVIERENEVLILVDLFAGSPFMLATQVFDEFNCSPSLDIFTGVNLSMLLEIASLAKTMSLKEIRDRVVEIGCQGIVDFRQKLERRGKTDGH